jgi:hypothetical protein
MSRYVAAAQSAYYKAITQLTKLQKERQAAEDQELESAIGFVSYPDPIPFRAITAEPESNSPLTQSACIGVDRRPVISSR